MPFAIVIAFIMTLFVYFSHWFNQLPGILKRDRLSRQWDQLND